MKITLTELPQLDALVEDMARKRQQPSPTQPLGLNYRNAMLLTAAEHPELFRARMHLRSGRTKEEDIPSIGASDSRLITLSDAMCEQIGGRRESGEAGDAMSVALGAIDREIAKKRAVAPEISYGTAWKLVASERRDLIEAYNAAAVAGTERR